jgi:hypothetical protein
MPEHALIPSLLDHNEEQAIPTTSADLLALRATGSNMLEPADASSELRFDYSQMDEGTAGEANAAVGRFYARQKAYVIDTGRDLLAVKGRLEHGLFLNWVQAEMKLTPRSAQRAMNTAEVLGSKSDTLSYLPPTTLYALAARSTPAPIRDEIVQRVEAGEALTAKAIDRHLWEARARAKQEDIDAKLAPEERKRKAQAKRASEARRRRENEKWRAEQDEAAAKRRAEADELAVILAPLLDAEAYRRVYELIHRVHTLDMRTALSAGWGRTEVGREHNARTGAAVMSLLDD